MIIPLLLALAVQDTAAAPAYWQQEVEYDITARLDETRGVIEGAERIRYVNRSPDTLTTFSLHLHLNAFRPGSVWAQDDSAEGRRRFNDLKDPDYAFNHVSDVRIMGQSVEAEYPFAPDSTIVRFRLPRPLAPGGEMIVTMDWDARPSTTPRRQGRRGRHYDFAQWYPKVVVYDRYGWNENPLHPAGEFYGEFATFRVLMDVPEDQVIGATGVPVCGDPGWARVKRGTAEPLVRADWYGDDTGFVTAGGRCAIRHGDVSLTVPAGRGRRTVGWLAEQVHHFGVSMSPDYRYEGGRHGDVAIHVLYQPGDDTAWGGGIAVRRTAAALEWLESLYGPFPWPQITNVHRIEGGGTEFPMIIMNGSASQGLIVHELAHNYTMGILANNEWREGWLDEGFASFAGTLFAESQGQTGAYERLEQQLLELELAGQAEPVSLVSHAYRSFQSYNISIYARAELFLHQLRYVVGDETLREIFREYYDRWKFRHVTGADFMAVSEDVCACDLSTFFGQWLHSVPRFDYAVGDVRVEEPAGNRRRWLTTVRVDRLEEGRIPVEVAVVAGADTVQARIGGLAGQAWVTLETAARPTAVVLDPRGRTHDLNRANDRRDLAAGAQLPEGSPSR